MADFRNCRRCGRVFNYIAGEVLCSECKKNDEKDFRRVKEFLYKNPGASITEISNELNISPRRINNYLREGRLEILDDGGNIILECMRCGRSIKSGRYCEECERALKKELTRTAGNMEKTLEQKETASRQARMRYLRKDNKK